MDNWTFLMMTVMKIIDDVIGGDSGGNCVAEAGHQQPHLLQPAEMAGRPPVQRQVQGDQRWQPDEFCLVFLSVTLFMLSLILGDQCWYWQSDELWTLDI